MAETTDHPQVPPDAVMSPEALDSRAPEPAGTYQPLSLLAMAGFGLAAVYALAVLVGGAISLMGHTPWLMPYWTFLFPLAALVVCRAARTRILSSEGTLSGLAFTTWGSRLAILFTVTYAAYYFATFLAVRGPSIDRGNEFLQKIKSGQRQEAFLMTMRGEDLATQGRSNDELRNEIETRFNQPQVGGGGKLGPFSRFCQDSFVRFLEMDGEQASTVPTGVAAWEYAKGGYRVTLTYHVTTSLVQFDMQVETFGRDPKPGEPKGRQWQIVISRGNTAILAESIKQTKRGDDFVQKTLKAQKYATDWAAKASDVAQLTPPEREANAKLIRGYERLWTTKSQHDEISERIRKTFQPSDGGNKLSFIMNLQSGGVPILRESEGRTTAWFDVTLRYLEEGTTMPHYLVEGRLVLSADSSEADKSPSAWRVDALELESGRTSPEWRRLEKRFGPGEAGPDKGGKAPAMPNAPPIPALRPKK